MTDLMEALFVYAQEHSVAPLLAEEGAYRSSICCAERQEEQLRAALDEQTSARLDALLREQDLARWIEERAAFRAGFRLALELARS